MEEVLNVVFLIKILKGLDNTAVISDQRWIFLQAPEA